MHNTTTDIFLDVDHAEFVDTFVIRRSTRRSNRHWGRAGIPETFRHRKGAKLSLYRHWYSDAQCRRVLENPLELGSLGKCGPCAGTPMHKDRYDERSIHHAELCYNNLSSFGESGITDFVRNCRSLVYLCSGAAFYGERTSRDAMLEDMAQFARAVGSSNLRRLSIQTRAGLAGVRSFVDNLSSSRVNDLDIEVYECIWSKEEEVTLVQSIASLLTNPARSKSIEHFSVGAPFSHQAKFVLLHIVNGHGIVEPDSRTHFTQKPNLSLVYFDLDYESDDENNEEIEYPPWMEHTRFTPANPPVLEEILCRNFQVCQRTRREAIALLCAARVIGCRAKHLGNGHGIVQFFMLPGELRIYILRMLAPHLDDTQFMNVLSWACCADTIGYCCGRRVSTRVPMEATLDVPMWNWDNGTTCESHAYDRLSHVSHDFDQSLSTARDAISFLENTGTNTASVDGWYT